VAVRRVMDAFRGRASRSGSYSTPQPTTLSERCPTAVAAFSRPLVVSTDEMCPRCALREATVDSTGFCESCTAEEVAPPLPDATGDRDPRGSSRVAALVRQLAWGARCLCIRCADQGEPCDGSDGYNFLTRAFGLPT
jgi:hypothetical protein